MYRYACMHIQINMPMHTCTTCMLNWEDTLRSQFSPPHQSRKSNWGHQIWRQAPFPTELSYWSQYIISSFGPSKRIVDSAVCLGWPYATVYVFFFLFHFPFYDYTAHLDFQAPGSLKSSVQAFLHSLSSWAWYHRQSQPQAGAIEVARTPNLSKCSISRSFIFLP